MTTRAFQSPPNEPGIGLGVALIALLALLFFAAFLSGFRVGPPEPGPAGVFLGVYLIAWGFMFLAAYFYSHKTFFFRALIWVCEHLSAPAGRKMAFFYFALATVIGVAAVAGALGL